MTTSEEQVEVTYSREPSLETRALHLPFKSGKQQEQHLQPHSILKL